jgi:HEAT repeat protein
MKFMDIANRRPFLSCSALAHAPGFLPWIGSRLSGFFPSANSIAETSSAISVAKFRKAARLSISAIAITIGLLVSQGMIAEELFCKNTAEIPSSESDKQEDQRLQELIKTLNEGDAFDRQRSAIALGNMGKASAVEPLVKALGDEDNFVRDFAARALGKIGDRKAVIPLIKAFDDENPLVQRSVALALGSLGDSRAVETLIKGMDSKHFMVRRAAAKALGDIGDVKAVDPLIKALGSGDIYIQNGAAIALAHIGKPAVPQLVNKLSDWTLGPRIAEILRDLNWQASSTEDVVRFNVAARNKQFLLDNWEIAKKVLIDDAHSENSLRSQNAVLALIAIGRNDVVDELVGILGKKGNVEMANAFMDCGNESLVEAGRNWAKMHEDEFKRKDNSPIVEWGGMKPG